MSGLVLGGLDLASSRDAGEQSPEKRSPAFSPSPALPTTPDRERGERGERWEKGSHSHGHRQQQSEVGVLAQQQAKEREALRDFSHANAVRTQSTNAVTLNSLTLNTATAFHTIGLQSNPVAEAHSPGLDEGGVSVVCVSPEVREVGVHAAGDDASSMKKI